MKKQLIVIMLMLMSIGETFAQSNISDFLDLDLRQYNRAFIRHRHTFQLEKGNRMVIELGSIKGYERLHDITDILERVQKNISFYTDSISDMDNSHLLVNYVTSVLPDNDKIRFRKVPNAEVFMERRGEMYKLKIQQDTIRILVYVAGDQKQYRRNDIFNDSYLPLYINLYLNSNKDISYLIADKEKLQHSIDTIAKIAAPKKKENFGYSTTAFYSNLNEGKEYITLRHALVDELYGTAFFKNHDRISLTGDIGMGLVRNKLAPFGEVGLEHRDYWVNGEEDYGIVGVSIAPYFLFNQQTDGKFRTYANWFVNIEAGNYFKKNNALMGLDIKRFTMGVGYLINPDQMHFQKTTIKIFSNLTLPKGLTISPEIIFTNNFKNIFPGITVKVF